MCFQIFKRRLFSRINRRLSKIKSLLSGIKSLLIIKNDIQKNGSDGVPNGSDGAQEREADSRNCSSCMSISRRGMGKPAAAAISMGRA